MSSFTSWLPWVGWLTRNDFHHMAATSLSYFFTQLLPYFTASFTTSQLYLSTTIYSVFHS